MSWHGIILPVDHPWWLTHFPPNGWGCECLPEQVSESDLKRNGWKVSNQAPTSTARTFFPAGNRDPIKVPKGIDPGFSYNPGIAHLRAVADKAMRSVVQAEQAGLDTALQTTIHEMVSDPAFNQFLALPDQAVPLALQRQYALADTNATSRIIRLSTSTVHKQNADFRNRGDIDFDAYRAIARIIEQPEAVVQQQANRLVFFGRFMDRWMRAVIKTTNDGAENYLVSAHYVRERSVRNQMQNATVIVDERRLRRS